MGEATVEVVDGAHAGAKTTAESTGRFSLAGPFDRTTRFRALKEGHAAVIKMAPAYCQGEECYGSLSFYLPPDGPQVEVSGEYNVTFVTDPSCTGFPDALRTRTYAATITPNPDPVSLSVTLTGASFLEFARQFRIGIAGDYLAFELGGGESPAVVEQLPGNAYLAFSGNATATAPPGASTISGNFDGWIEYCATRSPIGGGGYSCGTASNGQLIPGEILEQARCESANNRLILTRREGGAISPPAV